MQSIKWINKHLNAKVPAGLLANLENSNKSATSSVAEKHISN